MVDRNGNRGGGIDVSGGQNSAGGDFVGGDKITNINNYSLPPTKSKSFKRTPIIVGLIGAGATIIAAIIALLLNNAFPYPPPTLVGKQPIYCGYVRDASTGKGIPNAVVILELNPPIQKNTDSNGYFYFTGNPPFPTLPVKVDATAGIKSTNFLITLPNCDTPTQDIVL